MAHDTWELNLVRQGDVLACDLGPSTFYARRILDEWHLAAVMHDPTRQAPEEPLEPPDDLDALDWRRWVFAGKDGDLTLSPATPDRSVVVRPDYHLTLPPRQSAIFYVSMPVWVRVTAGADDTLLCELPTLTLSKIWFGDFLVGEVCYSLKSRARREYERGEIPKYRAICPVHVRNRAETDLELERICIRTAHLTLFDDRGTLWTSRVSAVFQGEEHAAKLTYGSKPPDECKGAEEITPPREKAQGNLLRKTFQSLRWFSA